MTTATLQERPVVSPPGVWTFPAFSQLSGSSGLDILYRHLPGQGIVSVHLLLDGPATVEPHELAGLAQITASALRQGTARRDAEAFATALERAGASLSASASDAATTVSVSAPASHLADALALMAEAITEPSFPAREVDRLVRQRIDRIKRELADPSGQASVVSQAALVAPTHRLHRPVGGTADTVRHIDRDVVEAFHAANLAGRRATLVVAGDLQGADPTAAVDAAFGGWPGTSAARRPAVPLIASPGPKVIVADRPGAAQTQLIVRTVGVDRQAPDWADLKVALHALGGSLNARLDAVLREEKGYTYGVRSSASAFRRGGLVTLLSGSVETGVTEPALLEAFCIIGAFAEEGLRDDERDASVRSLADGRPLHFETASAFTTAVASDLAHDLPADHTTRALANLRAVTTESASVAAASHVRVQDAVVVAAGDAGRILPGLEVLDHAAVEVVDDCS